jgi:hypothetical protein
MSEQFNMTFDVEWNAVKEERADRLPPEIGEQVLEITKVTGGLQKQGENEGAPYVSLLCTQQSGEARGTRACFKFIGFGKKMGKRGVTQVGETKAFIVDIGRADVFEQPSFNPESLVGTMFTANVAHSDYNGKTSIWLNQPKPYITDQGVPEEVDETPERVRPRPVQFAPGVVGSADPAVDAHAVAQAAFAAAQAALAAAEAGVQAQAPVAEPTPAQPRRIRPSAR